MTLKEAKLGAIGLALKLPDNEVVSIRRLTPRKFAYVQGQTPFDNKLVILVHSNWARDGFYKRLGWH